MRIVYFVGMCFLGTIIFSGDSYSQHKDCIVDRKRLKQMVVDSMNHPTALQDIVWGPLKDGRFLRVQFEYLETGEGTQFFRKQSPVCVQIDRRDAARASMLIDAFYECERLNACDRLPEYADRIFESATIAALPFFEDGDAALEEKMEDWCLSEAEARQWMGSFVQFIFALQMHELAHAALHGQQTISVELEAEADGFASAVAEMADLSVTAAGRFMAHSVEAERSYELIGSHPPSECRIEAVHLGLKEWYELRPDLTPPPGLSAKPGSNISNGAIKPFLPDGPGLCDKYAGFFDQGVKKASRLVSQQSGFKFLFEGYHDRCEINGGTKR